MCSGRHCYWPSVLYDFFSDIESMPLVVIDTLVIAIISEQFSHLIHIR